jgi:hypothetical protein
MIVVTVILAITLAGMAATLAWNKWGAWGGMLIGAGTLTLLLAIARWLGVFARTGPDPRL